MQSAYELGISGKVIWYNIFSPTENVYCPLLNLLWQPRIELVNKEHLSGVYGNSNKNTRVIILLDIFGRTFCKRPHLDECENLFEPGRILGSPSETCALRMGNKEQYTINFRIIITANKINSKGTYKRTEAQFIDVLRTALY